MNLYNYERFAFLHVSKVDTNKLYIFRQCDKKIPEAGNRRTDNTTDKRESTKGKQRYTKHPHSKQNIKQHEPHWKQEVNTGATEGYSVPGYLIKYCWKLW